MASYHARSLSFSSTAHPIADKFDEHLNRLSSSQAASTSSSSLNQTLTNLKDLYCCVDELLQLPLNQRAISQNLHSKWIEEALDGSLRFLDMCTTSRDVLVQSKERLQDIQLILRRRCSGEINVNNEIVQYLKTRKSAKKVMKTNEANGIENMLKDAQTMTVDVFKSVLSYIGGIKLESQKSKWSLVNKLMHQGGNKEAMSEFEVVDTTLESIVCQKNKGGMNMLQVENIRSQMVKFESQIQVLNETLDSLFRYLVQTRATLLNILSN